MRTSEAVISLPSQVPAVRRGLFAAITLVAWTGFIWLMSPLLTLLIWMLGLRTAYDTTFGGFASVDPWLTGWILVVSVTAAAALILWAEVQRRRFTGVERRSRAPDATVEEIAEVLGCDPGTAAQLRSGHVVRLTMREDGSPEAAAVARIPRPRRPVGSAPVTSQPDDRATAEADSVAASVATGAS